METLCSVEEVTAYRPIQADTEVLDRLVIAVTDKMLQIANREFVVDVADPTVPTMRAFDVDRGLVEDRELEVGDMAAAPAGIVVRGNDGVISEVVDLATVTCLPRRRREHWRPITVLRFERWLPTSAIFRWGGMSIEQLHFGAESIEVTAKWGFPAIPPSINQEAIKTVHAWYLKDAGSLTKTFKDAVQPTQSGISIGQHQLPLSAQQECERWRVPFGLGTN